MSEIQPIIVERSGNWLKNPDYDSGDYVAYSDVVELAKRWGIPQHILAGGDPTYAKAPIHANGICDHMKPVNECTICHR